MLPPEPATSNRRKYAVVLGALLCQMGLGYGYVLGALAGDILGELEWTRTAYSGARAPQLFVIALASPLVGAATIRFGSRQVLASAAVVLGITFLLLGDLDSLWQLYGLVILMGFAVAGLGDIVVSQVVSQWFTRNRGLALGVVFTGSNIGGFLLTRFSSSVAESESWRLAFVTMGLGSFLVLVPAAWFLVRDAMPDRGDDENALEASPDDAGALDGRAAVRTRSFWILAFALFTFFFYFMALLEHLVLFLTDHGLPSGEAREWFSNAIGLGFASKIVLGWVADRLAPKATVLIDYSLVAASSIALLWLPDPAWLPFFIGSYGFATAARDVVYPLIITRCFGLRYMAQIYGLLMLALLPGGALGPLFAASVHDSTGSYTVSFQVFAVLNLAAVIALGFIRNEREQLGAIPPVSGGKF